MASMLWGPETNEVYIVKHIRESMKTCELLSTQIQQTVLSKIEQGCSSMWTFP